MNKTMNILIIGGTGFLGSHIVNKLIGRNHNIHIVSRNIQKEMAFDKSRVNLIQGDITNLEFIEKLPTDIDIIIYVAMPPFKPGRISDKKFNEIESITRLYFENVIELAKRIKSVLLITSGASFITKENEIADETWPIARIGMAMLGRSYDELISKVKKEKTIPLIEMLPAQIYGNGGLFLKMINMAKSGKVVILGNGKNHLPRIHVDDCADESNKGQVLQYNKGYTMLVT